MRRAQGILKRWKSEKLKNTENYKIPPLTYLIELEYKNYVKLCYYTHEASLPKSKWLWEEINLSEK